MIAYAYSEVARAFIVINIAPSSNCDLRSPIVPRRSSITNVRPWVERNPPCRDESIVQGSQVSLLRVCEIMITVLLFFSSFSVRVRFAVRKYCSLDYAADRPVDSVESRFSCPSLLHHDDRPVSEFRGYRTKVLSRKNMIPSIQDMERKKTCMLSLFGQRGSYTIRRAYL